MAGSDSQSILQEEGGYSMRINNLGIDLSLRALQDLLDVWNRIVGFYWYIFC